MLLSESLKVTTGLPSAEALKAVEGYTLLRTDRNGWIELSTDGQQMWLEAEKMAGYKETHGQLRG